MTHEASILRIDHRLSLDKAPSNYIHTSGDFHEVLMIRRKERRFNNSLFAEKR